MNVMEAINLLKKYNLYEKAKSQCKREKISEAPYDMQGHHEVYCRYLSEKRIEIRNREAKLQKIKCKEWNNISEDKKPLHDSCMFVELSLKNEYCSKCNHYKIIQELEQEMEILLAAQRCLEDAADYDAIWR